MPAAPIWRLPATRRQLLTLPAASMAASVMRVGPVGATAAIERETLALVERAEGLRPPLVLGIARVVLRPGVELRSTTPEGVRMIVVESGVLGVMPTSRHDQPVNTLEVRAPEARDSVGDEVFVPAGTAMTFGGVGVERVRNPGGKSAVALDVVVYRGNPRPMARAFTIDDGVSFQLLASADAAAAPTGKTVAILERLRLEARASMPDDLSAGLTLMYIKAGTIEVAPAVGNVFSARAAAPTPYSMPGSLQPLDMGTSREVTAGGVVFVPVAAAAVIANRMGRGADLMTLTVREAG